MRFRGLANGELSAAAEQAGFDALITIDRHMQYQQSFRSRTIALVVIEARSTNLEDILPLIPDVLVALESTKPGSVVRVGIG